MPATKTTCDVGLMHETKDFDFKEEVQVYLTDIELFSQMNSVYTKYFTKDRPARTTVAVASLVGKARIEITVTARK